MIVEICGLRVDFRRKKIKNFNITITRYGDISLSVPTYVSDAEAFAFFESKFGWVKKRMSATCEKRAENTFSVGENIYVFGRVVTIGSTIGKYRLDGDVFYVRDRDDPDKRVAAVSKILAKILADKARLYFDKWERITGLRPSGVTIRKTTSRWGSCNKASGKINLSFYLVSLPEECLNYVILHELCHLEQANHGPLFKSMLDRYYPEWREVRSFMRNKGEEYRLILK